VSSFADAKLEFIKTLGFFWTQVFRDQAFLDGYADSVLVKFQDLDAYADTLPDYLSRYLIPLTKSSEIRLFAFREADKDTYAARYGQDFTYGQDLGYGDIQPVPATVRYPIESGFKSKFLAVGLDDGLILQAGRDYTIQDDVIQFNQDPCTLPGAFKISETLEDGSISYITFLWGFEVEEDVNALCEFYGVLAGVCAETSETLKKAVNLAWNLRVDGASVLHTVELLSLITGVDAVTEDGTVDLVFVEGDKVCVATENQIYTAPLPYEAIVGPGAKISPGDNIFNAFVVRGPNDPLFQDDFEALALGKGELRGTNGGILLVNQVEEVVPSLPPGFRTIRVTDNAWLVLDRDNRIIGTVESEEDAAAVILGSPTKYLSFYVGGAGEDVRAFNDKLNSGDPSFFDILEEAAGHVPVSLNPLQTFRDQFFRNNATFVKIRGNRLADNITGQLLSVLAGTYSAGSRIFVILEKQTSEDAYSLADAAEEVTLFYATEDVEDTFSTVSDRVIAESVV
jgi:hypothetical protein